MPPEVVEALRENLPPRCVVDGELVVARHGRLDFEALQQRIPAFPNFLSPANPAI